MCGFTGFLTYLNHPKDGDLQYFLEKSAERLSHRGPDFQGTYFLNDPQKRFRLGFSHALLSIVGNPVDGQQPFHDAGNVLVFNGMIYNYRELGAELKKSGFTLKTGTDTEVLAKGLGRYGYEFLKRCKGMFAFAFYNSAQSKLLLGRDPLGVKPLYCYRSDNSKLLMFSSEYKTLLPFLKNLSIDEKSLSLYLRYRYIPGAGTMVAGIHKVKPGTVLEINLNDESSKVLPFWTLASGPSRNASDDIYSTLKTAVQRRSVSDVHFGALLSGGIDSSIVCDFLSDKDQRMETYTLRISDPKLDETSAAREIANLLHIKNHEVAPIVPSLENLDRLTYHLDDPYGDPIILALDAIFAQIKTRNRVIVTGEGADELFSGYIHHRLAYLLSATPQFLKNFGKHFLDVLPASVIRSLVPYSGKLEDADLELAKNRLRNFLAQPGLLSFQEIFWLFDRNDIPGLDKFTDTQPPVDSSEALYAQVRRWDLNYWLCDSQLSKLDKIAMSHSIEAREPFVDVDLVEQVMQVEPRKHFSLFKDKVILRNSLRGRSRIPDSIINARKKSFYQPIQGPHADFMDELKSFLRSRRSDLDVGMAPSTINSLLEQNANSLLAPKRLYALASLVFWKKSLWRTAQSERFSLN